MLKILLLNFHFADNYGAVLQSYALQQFLKNSGFNVENINFIPDKINHSYTLFPKVNYILRTQGLIRTIKISIIKSIKFPNRYARRKEFKAFRKEHIDVTKLKFKSVNELYEYDFKADYAIVGSDQVWNPDITGDNEAAYFLNFVGSSAHKISYAASVAKELDNNKIYDFTKYLNDFKAISVREKSTADVLNKEKSINVSVTVDPTMLLNRDNYLEISEDCEIKEQFILVYDLRKDDSIMKTLAFRLAKEKNWKIISYKQWDTNSSYYKGSFNKFGPSKFLDLFTKAEFVFSSSFHGTVFSLIFEKDFLAINSPSRGNRIKDLLDKIDLDDRVISTNISKSNTDIISKNVFESRINYSEVSPKLNELIEDSKQFLHYYVK